eukprot:2627207-Rhodomonas_salina.1
MGSIECTPAMPVSCSMLMVESPQPLAKPTGMATKSGAHRIETGIHVGSGVKQRGEQRADSAGCSRQSPLVTAILVTSRTRRRRPSESRSLSRRA